MKLRIETRQRNSQERRRRFSPRRSSTAARIDGGVYRCRSCPVWSQSICAQLLIALATYYTHKLHHRSLEPLCAARSRFDHVAPAQGHRARDPLAATTTRAIRQYGARDIDDEGGIDEAAPGRDIRGGQRPTLGRVAHEAATPADQLGLVRGRLSIRPGLSYESPGCPPIVPHQHRRGVACTASTSTGRRGRCDVWGHRDPLRRLAVEIRSLSEDSFGGSMVARRSASSSIAGRSRWRAARWSD